MTPATVRDRLMMVAKNAGAVIDKRAGTTTVAPNSDSALAAVLGAASDGGWHMTFRGSGTWSGKENTGLIISSEALDSVVDVRPGDLVAEVQAGVTMQALASTLAERKVWFPVDPPGLPQRTLGSVLATGTSGPLRNGFGAVRDQILGVTVLTPRGRRLQFGGQVVKNVAGFDLTKLIVGSFGAFGLITSAYIRLRSMPAIDTTLLAVGTRDELFEHAQHIRRAGTEVASVELLAAGTSGVESWALVVRIVGSELAVSKNIEEIRRAAPGAFSDDPTPYARSSLPAALGGVGRHPVTMRVGCQPTQMPRAATMIHDTLGSSAWMMASVGSASIRWSGDASIPQLQRAREEAARKHMPVTIERAPREVLGALGHFGLYRSGVEPIVNGLRDVFDPDRQVSVALGPRTT